jgi:hypothetical protein
MAEIAIPYRAEAALERGIEDALSLMEEGPLDALLATADAVRDRFKGRSVSYSRKAFIPRPTRTATIAAIALSALPPKPASYLHAAGPSSRQVPLTPHNAKHTSGELVRQFPAQTNNPRVAGSA